MFARPDSEYMEHPYSWSRWADRVYSPDVAENGDRDERSRAVQELIEHLAAGSAAVPTTTFGRLRRTAGALLRGRSALLSPEHVDVATVERLVRSLGELKGVAMKMGQILSYIDDALPEETSALLGVLRTWSQPTELLSRIDRGLLTKIRPVQRAPDLT